MDLGEGRQARHSFCWERSTSRATADLRQLGVTANQDQFGWWAAADAEGVGFVSEDRGAQGH